MVVMGDRAVNYVVRIKIVNGVPGLCRRLCGGSPCHEGGASDGPAPLWTGVCIQGQFGFYCTAGLNLEPMHVRQPSALQAGV